MGHPDDDDKLVYLDYHNEEIGKLEKRAEELAGKLVDAKCKLLDAETLLEIAVGQASDTTNPMWLNEVQQWLINYRKRA